MITGKWMEKKELSDAWTGFTRFTKHMSDAPKRKAKQKWTIEKPKLDNARQLRGIFFVEPDDEEIKHTMKNALGKLEIPMPAAMPCKTTVMNPGQKGRCTDVFENSKVRMPRHLDTSTKAQVAQIMVQYGRLSRSS